MNKFQTGLLAATAAFAMGVGSAQADITVGVAGPMTGQYASFGEQLAKGAEQAVKDINAKGGVLGEKLVLKKGDDACDPKQAVAVANQFVNDKVVFVAGHFCSGSSIPASAVYNEEGIVQISPASTNPKLTEQGFENVFRTCGRDDQQGPTAGDFLKAHFPGQKIAIIHDKTAYGKGLADETKSALNKAGVQEALYEAITAGEKDYSALVTKLKNEGIKIIYLGGYHTEAGLIIRQAKEQGLDARIVSGDALVSSEFASIAGPAGDGTLFTFSPDPRKNPEAAAVVKSFTDAGYNAEGYTLYTYGAVQAWAQAVEKAKSTDVDKVAKALKSGQFSTVLGPIGFDAQGDVSAPGYVMYEWKGGNYDYFKN
ncbi:branched-chain amino acid ABC transporter substrate-binding protein [Rhodospirillum rubrum]|uniref:Extracellular ligand-binding receptor n=1 Tax=Rhodospirillum rubrum (strain ATCC 11170 / ATH 1.1.1 / DSM 467 / LMG 4362 / NCIMB 8255 / S1) TaxID=269796 RepID=Q2RTJ9_RHORT|nr:branched-chain amino acid ABC transporter substrate-binding protein [Rhodospirillum rubrum]ABC22546.1 Extracellular ligand-binding receptor [Rhodospirillum rubrum ATCC 11170]AEO48264.1 extracellular ligand-binding receptor [Rhodospirillum rubrum F11]MBK5954135.1 branched chain amino acid ABC transporter substrate-binding protein [Rhodospirillum rubrum]QXG82175.1 branched-chain amino acid ABC transporter substrate-binding protein [Rhodospirillum rubrum]